MEPKKAGRIKMTPALTDSARVMKKEDKYTRSDTNRFIPMSRYIIMI